MNQDVDISDNDILLNKWISMTSVEYLRMMCVKDDGRIDIPLSLRPELLECLRYTKSILGLYHIESDAYNNWLLILLEAVYTDVFHAKCFKSANQKDCKFKKLIDQIDSLFARVDQSTFLNIG
ncbi:hypothetical protein BDCR2A_01608 [Borrelia duttonii CR2A]|uniref:Uncharacterized protein n=1 Tax=Borrelia duttonii CR2A TaxID=1432657 RepID=W6TFF2_9SPIR|nr:hypothetical protein [Borrelia duttonii]ETZ17472.1 hypothetical protein BDCR2A_01608 [Borrelia duttonii CR2A]